MGPFSAHVRKRMAIESERCSNDGLRIENAPPDQRAGRGF